jgi:hypothetical protein
MNHQTGTPKRHRQVWQWLRASMLPLLALFGAAANADYAEDWGPEVGSAIPLLEAFDQDGELRTLDSLTGNQGLLLFLNRSADW